MGGLSDGIDEDLEQFDDELLHISESCALSSSDQYIISEISVDIELRKL